MNIVTLSALLILALCHAEHLTSSQQKAIDLVHRLYDALEKRDFDTFESCFEPDSSMRLEDGDPVKGAEKIRSSFEGLLNNYLSTIRFSLSNFVVSSKNTVSFHVSTFAVNKDGKCVTTFQSTVAVKTSENLKVKRMIQFPSKELQEVVNDLTCTGRTEKNEL